MTYVRFRETKRWGCFTFPLSITIPSIEAQVVGEGETALFCTILGQCRLQELACLREFEGGRRMRVLVTLSRDEG